MEYNLMGFKFNPFTGNFDVVNPNNFSFNYIATGMVLFVPQYQQMVVEGHLDMHGDIDLAGDLSVV